MNQQAFYRDTAIGEFQLDANGRLAYRSWGQRRCTLQVQQHRRNQAMSHLLQNVGLTNIESTNLQNSVVSGFSWAKPPERPWRMEGMEPFFDDSITKSYLRPGTIYEERFGRNGTP